MSSILLTNNLDLYYEIQSIIFELKFLGSFHDFFKDERAFNYILIDDNFLKNSSNTPITKLIEKYPSTPKYIISDQNDINQVEFYQSKGIENYILKDHNFLNRIEKHFKKLKIDNYKRFQMEDLIKGNSVQIKKIFNLIKKAASSTININITGETGTGKELVAKAIHQFSSKKHHKIVTINISSIPKDLIESELFGYEEGAFTGATKKRLGKFEEAKGGTLFLDEIGELPMNLQTKLLRVLQEGELSRLGGNEIIKTDIRLITATHKDLQNEVSNNNFREDLYYRILGLPIHLPPLRERKEDILEIAESFISKACEENDIQPIKKLSQNAIKKLTRYHFPGNIRQLKAIIELSTILSENTTIFESDILIENRKNELNLLQKERTLEEYNIEIIDHFLKKYQGKVNFVADKLAMSKSKIYKWINEGKLSKP